MSQNAAAAGLNYDLELDNDDPEHRRILIAALRREGLDAYEYNSGGGIMHVCVNLVDGEQSLDELLQIATGSVASPCDVSLMGWHDDAPAQDSNWTRTPTLRDAVDAFRKYAGERDVWAERLRRGELKV